MPIYEYRCDSCNTVIEKRQRFSDPPLAVCEVCHGPLEKLISAPGLQFKGSGWYVTDYAGKGKNGGNGATNGTKTTDSSETKSDKKTGTETASTATQSDASPAKSDSSSK
jgi:putative FmdB family regulatory protein